MNTASAWEIDNLSPAARSVAEDAAHRVGLTLEEWERERTDRVKIGKILAQPDEAPAEAT